MADEPDEGVDVGEAEKRRESASDETAPGSESADSTSNASDGSEPPREAKTDGEGGVVDDLPEHEREEPSYPDPDDDVGGIEAPPDDQEMPLADHIEEMIMRLARVFLVGAAATAIGLLGASPAIEYIWLNIFPGPTGEVPPPHVYHPLELWLTRIKVAGLLGIMAALPMFVYECYLFMRPGLYPNERKYYLAAVPTSVVLAGMGMLFSFFLVLPVLFRYFTFYAEGSADIAYALGETFNLIITLTGFLAIVFQIPLFIMLAIMMGVTTRRWLAQKRLYFWAAFFGLSFMFTVDPTMMAPVIVAIVMILLFEGTLLLLKWTGRE
ncbi:twin-arginine translocase subunit TatC [Natrialbaceae archaeon AArc-T1-2]|uniref:twin-arginine translocase subunit TatC n=1 Tax=Natrialbaceae archaeon AArc-T1-2 TaxID=3053904 RepID=UPI00255A7AE2|nr:twin-arginine translocase subunit TatC [Natrialbaceae archaeon AArc-T1-2]WIV65849.1 twin-arginine translocase subunit TatC [Natrialbaceae archaeon AArc-T1-2]